MPLRKISMFKVIIILFLTFSCATAKVIIPRLELRTLRLNKSLTGFKYRYCTKRTYWLKKCKEGKWKTDTYLFTDRAAMSQLKAMGFVLRVHKPPIN